MAVSRGRIGLLVKTLFFTILAPGTVTVLVPYLLVLPRAEFDVGAFRFAGIAPIVLGAAALFYSAWNFVFVGRGTPAPLDPPKELVAAGLFRFVRNPMYVGICTLLVGEALLFQSWRILAYAFLVWLLFHLFVIIYEEPHLRRKFGTSYENYCRAVPRWIPRWDARRARK